MSLWKAGRSAFGHDIRAGLWQLGWGPMSGLITHFFLQRTCQKTDFSNSRISHVLPEMLNEAGRVNGCGELVLRLPEHCTLLFRPCLGACEDPLLPLRSLPRMTQQSRYHLSWAQQPPRLCPGFGVVYCPRWSLSPSRVSETSKRVS